jgi:hypothetical protein
MSRYIYPTLMLFLLMLGRSFLQINKSWHYWTIYLDINVNIYAHVYTYITSSCYFAMVGHSCIRSPFSSASRRVAANLIDWVKSGEIAKYEIRKQPGACNGDLVHWMSRRLCKMCKMYVYISSFPSCVLIANLNSYDAYMYSLRL